MSELERQIEDLTTQLQELRRRQIQMNGELVSVERKLEHLKVAFSEKKESEPALESGLIQQEVEQEQEVPYIVQAKLKNNEKKNAQRRAPIQVNRELEDFIGTNVISKIGILVTIIGVFIGAKYAIDNELISPLMRIVAGYLSGAILIFIAYRLKSKYEYFSSILIGGGLAVTYFITYIAYSFYGLFPLGAAFVIMVITTAAAVAIALWYNQKIIALLGQVAAYAIPFLLGDGYGNPFILFSYITVINFGLLTLSFKKDWKILYHIAFFLTWLVYFSLIFLAEKIIGNFSAALIFLTINFSTFYVTFLAYKIIKKELYEVGEIGILLFNALFFFFLGAYLINQHFNNIHVLTWFTIANAIVHFCVGYFIYRLRLVDNSVYQFVLGLALLFVTIAIPIELDGNWVTVLWTLEAASLVYVAHSSKRQLYLEIAIPLIAISLLSLLQDWGQNYDYLRNDFVSSTHLNNTPFVNINFVLSLFVSVCIGCMTYWVNDVYKMTANFKREFFRKILPLAFLSVLYFTIFNEIHFTWDKNIALYHYKASFLYEPLTLIIYSSVYVVIWVLVNSAFIKREDFHYLLMVLAFFVNAVFLFHGLFLIGELRGLYIAKAAGGDYAQLTIRYFAFAALALLWLSVAKALLVFTPSEVFQKVISTVFNTTLLAVISNEFIHWMALSGYQNQYKLVLSLICGVYALILLFVGMVKKKKHLRILAMVLFAATLLKLFFYDLASLSTISKTIVLVILGVLLLSASFLYNKYKDLLFTSEETSS